VTPRCVRTSAPPVALSTCLRATCQVLTYLGRRTCGGPPGTIDACKPTNVVSSMPGSPRGFLSTPSVVEVALAAGMVQVECVNHVDRSRAVPPEHSGFANHLEALGDPCLSMSTDAGAATT
jgi:hypothetical protein